MAISSVKVIVINEWLRLNYFTFLMCGGGVGGGGGGDGGGNIEKVEEEDGAIFEIDPDATIGSTIRIVGGWATVMRR
jgi:hypothetical protein